MFHGGFVVGVYPLGLGMLPWPWGFASGSRATKFYGEGGGKAIALQALLDQWPGVLGPGGWDFREKPWPWWPIAGEIGPGQPC